jgi:hypothetical protein
VRREAIARDGARLLLLGFKRGVRVEDARSALRDDVARPILDTVLTRWFDISRPIEYQPSKQSSPNGHGTTGVTAPPLLNAVGKPYSPQFDPKYKLRTSLTKIGRLRKPYGPRFGRADDDQGKRRRRKVAPAPLFDALERRNRRYPIGNGVTTASPFVADCALVDMIRRLDEVRGLLETADAADTSRVLVLADSALRAAAEFLVQLREERLGL